MDFENPNGAKCSEDVAKEVEKLKKANVDGIVLDLRTNGGGSLTEVVKMVGLFIEDGPVVQVKSRDASQPQQLKDRDKSVLYNGPLAVMVDEFSASASEIFAAAIQDYKRGIVIGSSSTYGKGTVQRSIPLNPESQFQFSKGDEEDLGSIKLTLQKFYRINGGTTQLQGVKPDVVIPDRYELVKAREKDNPTALSWDEIAKADYKIWNKTYSDEVIVGEARQQINSSMVFSSIKKQIEWIDKQNDKDYPLNLTKYQAEQKSLKAAYQQLDSLYKLKKELDVINSGNELITFKEDSSKLEKNKQFLNRLKTDIYLDESIKIIRNMIAHDSPATKTIGPAKKD